MGSEATETRRTKMILAGSWVGITNLATFVFGMFARYVSRDLPTPNAAVWISTGASFFVFATLAVTCATQLHRSTKVVMLIVELLLFEIVVVFVLLVIAALPWGLDTGL